MDSTFTTHLCFRRQKNHKTSAIITRSTTTTGKMMAKNRLVSVALLLSGVKTSSKCKLNRTKSLIDKQTETRVKKLSNFRF